MCEGASIAGGAVTRGLIKLTRYKGEPLEVEAELINDSWAIHETASGGLWRVTHRPTGMRLTDCPTEADARAFTAALPDPYNHDAPTQRERVRALFEAFNLPYLR